MGMITVIAKKDLGFNHLYGEIRKGNSYLIEEEHFDPKLYKNAALGAAEVIDLSLPTDTDTAPERSA